MTRKIRNTASVLSLFLALLFVFISCGETTDPVQTSAEQTNPVVGPDNTTEEQTTNLAPAVVDLGKYEFSVLCKDNSLWVQMHYSENGTENGEAINDSLFRREALLEDMYNCEIDFRKDSDAVSKLKNTGRAGDAICEAAFMSGNDNVSAATSGVIRDLAGIPQLRLDGEWWDQRIQKEYMIGSHLFMIDGEINIRDDLRTMGFIYNKELYDSYGYNSEYGVPYSLVSEGKWSLDTLLQMINGKTEDPKNDNGMWGLLSENAGPYAYFFGSGYKAIVSENGEIVLKIEEETIYNQLEKMLNLSVNPDVMLANDGTHFVGGSVWDDVSAVFESGHALFRSTTLSAVNRLTNMKADYGILPIPNAGDSKEYYCYVSGSNNSPLVIPYNVVDIDKSATVIEAMAYYSYAPLEGNSASLHDAFYALLADARLARTYEDTAMLDIIFGSKTYDMDQVTAITGFESSFYNLVKAKNVTTLTSQIKAITKSADKNISRFMSKINELYPET